MKYLKTYEQIDNPKVGDYVKVDSSQFSDLLDFFDNEIGKINSINSKELETHGFPYYVFFEKIIPASQYASDDSMAFRKDELLAWAPDIESLKIKIDLKKYNL